mmetsp:Transcript_30119/g.89615  ORF Transcript_30119/g.89615 Transcript_30119/m.89615 type:complete len:666 (+) Transcript_30119:782-2779(+)
MDEIILEPSQVRLPIFPTAGRIGTVVPVLISWQYKERMYRRLEYGSGVLVEYRRARGRIPGEDIAQMYDEFRVEIEIGGEGTAQQFLVVVGAGRVGEYVEGDRFAHRSATGGGGGGARGSCGRCASSPLGAEGGTVDDPDDDRQCHAQRRPDRDLPPLVPPYGGPNVPASAALVVLGIVRRGGQTRPFREIHVHPNGIRLPLLPPLLIGSTITVPSASADDASSSSSFPSERPSAAPKLPLLVLIPGGLIPKTPIDHPVLVLFPILLLRRIEPRAQSRGHPVAVLGRGGRLGLVHARGAPGLLGRMRSIHLLQQVRGGPSSRQRHEMPIDGIAGGPRVDLSKMIVVAAVEEMFVIEAIPRILLDFDRGHVLGVQVVGTPDGPHGDAGTIHDDPRGAGTSPSAPFDVVLLPRGDAIVHVVHVVVVVIVTVLDAESRIDGTLPARVGTGARRFSHGVGRIQSVGDSSVDDASRATASGGGRSCRCHIQPRQSRGLPPPHPPRHNWRRHRDGVRTGKAVGGGERRGGRQGIPHALVGPQVVGTAHIVGQFQYLEGVETDVELGGHPVHVLLLLLSGGSGVDGGGRPAGLVAVAVDVDAGRGGGGGTGVRHHVPHSRAERFHQPGTTRRGLLLGLHLSLSLPRPRLRLGVHILLAPAKAVVRGALVLDG